MAYKCPGLSRVDAGGHGAQQYACLGLGEKMPLLNRVYATENYDRFSAMADHMGVSKQALAIRLKGLGLLDRDDLQDPYALTIVYPDDEELKRLRGGA